MQAVATNPKMSNRRPDPCRSDRIARILREVRHRVNAANVAQPAIGHSGGVMAALIREEMAGRRRPCAAVASMLDWRCGARGALRSESAFCCDRL